MQLPQLHDELEGVEEEFPHTKERNVIKIAEGFMVRRADAAVVILTPGDKTIAAGLSTKLARLVGGSSHNGWPSTKTPKLLGVAVVTPAGSQNDVEEITKGPQDYEFGTAETREFKTWASDQAAMDWLQGLMGADKSGAPTRSDEDLAKLLRDTLTPAELRRLPAVQKLLKAQDLVAGV